MNRDVVCFVALDDVLRFVPGGVVYVSFEAHIGNTFFTIVPRTRPASEFHSTWSPRLKLFAMSWQCLTIFRSADP